MCNKTNIALRFDVDTIADLKHGIPRLIKLADVEGIPFTFFINPGKAINYTLIAKKIFNFPSSSSGKFSTLQRIGLKYWLLTILTNPYIGFTHENILYEIINNGHELGIHGTTNHSTWLYDVDLDKKVNFTIDVVLSWYKNHFGMPFGFTSPGFRKSEVAYRKLSSLGFTYISDELHTDLSSSPIIKKYYQLKDIPTLSTFDGIPLFEQAAYYNKDPRKYTNWMLAFIKNYNWCVVYDHPSFAVGQGYPYLQSFIKKAKDFSCSFITMKDICTKVSEI